MTGDGNFQHEGTSILQYNAETTLQTNASKKGLGACLIQMVKLFVMLPEHSQRLSRIIRTWNERH